MYEIFLGIRYLKAKRKQRFISVITVISVLGVMVGVMALIVVLSVMNGFRADLMSKILGVNSHVLVLNLRGPFAEYENIFEKTIQVPGVVAATPFIHTQVMINHTGMVSGAVLRGVDVHTAPLVVTFEEMVKAGSLRDLEREEKDQAAIILGSELARQVGAQVGAVVTVISPEGKLTPLGRSPHSQAFQVVGIFDSGMYEYDSSMAYIALSEAQSFLTLGERVTGLGVRVVDPYQSDRIAGEIQKALGYPFWTKDWKLMNRSLFAALKLEKLTMFIILTMIVLVGALNIISTLVMVVMEKTRDVAILRAMGATARSVMSIFMLQGLLVGFIGTIAGLFSGLGLCQLLHKYQFIDLPADVYYISKLPVRVESLDVFLVSISAVVISFLATLYPSWYASRLNPVESFRYE